MTDAIEQNFLEHARSMGRLLLLKWPATEVPMGPGLTPQQVVPKAHADEIADLITLGVAEMIQAYIDAGSEREVTMENLGPHIAEEIHSWTEV